MNEEMIAESKRWLAQALNDLEFLPAAVQAKKHDLACFLSHQVAEKALRGYLFSQGEEAAFTHSVFKLCDMAAGHDREFTQLKDQVKNLDRFYIAARYPNAIPDCIPAEFFNQADAEEAIAMARKAVQFVQQKIAAQSN